MMSKNTDIIAAITANMKQASTQALDMSFNELLDMWTDGELDIAPNYQRLFRWSTGQQSRFIESLLLEMPVPPIFVIEEEENTYQLIDGLQRISSYFHLRGKLEAPYADPPIKKGDKLILRDCDIVKELNGLSFDDFPTALQIRLKRRFIRVEVIRKETDPRFKYHMFKRLNTGGDRLSNQQVRNAAMRLLDHNFPDFIIKASNYISFKSCTEYLTTERIYSAFDQELVLRFFALKNNRNSFKHEVTDFLDEYMESIVDPEKPGVFDYYKEQNYFEKTFDSLKNSIGEYAFAFANKAKNDLSAGFSIYHFEAVTIGLQSIIDRINPEDSTDMQILRYTIRSIKLDQKFISITTGGGKNSPGPLNERIDFVAGRLQNAFA